MQSHKIYLIDVFLEKEEATKANVPRVTQTSHTALDQGHAAPIQIYSTCVRHAF